MHNNNTTTKTWPLNIQTYSIRVRKQKTEGTEGRKKYKGWRAFMEEVILDALIVRGCGIEKQIQAAMEISKLTSKQKHKLVERGIMNPLISMLNSQDYQVIEASLLALLSLAYGSERNKIRMARSGAIPILLNLVQCQNIQLTELAIASLFIISTSAGNKLAIAYSGATTVLIESLNTDYQSNNPITTQAKLDILATLQNLSTCDQIIPSLISSNLLLYLLQIIYATEKSSLLVEKSMALLERLVSQSEPTLRETALTAGAIQALVETMEDGTNQCKEHAVGILLLICQSCRETYRGTVLREGIMPGLLQLSIDGTWRAKNLARALLLLLRDCGGGSSKKKGKELKNEVMESIMERIEDDEDGFSGNTLKLVEQMIAKLSA